MVKVNLQSKSTVKVNASHNLVNGWSMMTSADWWVTSVDDVAVMTSPRADISRRKLARGGAWRRVEARGGAWRRMTERGTRDQPYRNFERRVGAHAVFEGVEAFTVL